MRFSMIDDCELVPYWIAAAIGMWADRVRGGPVQDGDGVPQVDGAVRGRQVAAAGELKKSTGSRCVYVLLETLNLTTLTALN